MTTDEFNIRLIELMTEALNNQEIKEVLEILSILASQLEMYLTLTKRQL